jgi:hypothetical protein
MKKLTLAIVIAVIGSILLMGRYAFGAQPEPYTCPVGQYPIGDGQCHLEPTGCPYGDSIPLDSPKCAQTEKQEEVEAHDKPFVDQAPAATPQPAAPTESWGK